MPKNLRGFLRKLVDLREGAEDKKTIVENVKDESDFTAVRFWILVSAVLVASVGLNMNSVPVIIGAMLISPLMGPIVSMGVALSTYDWGLMRRSLRNFIILTAIGVVMSTIYFALSPINNAQSELLARTQPTIFDILIAIFGGVAGFIAVSRARGSGTVIPGVAIATALMPPLCTIGYGIGTLQAKFFLGASYLYLINSIFICLAVLVVAGYMKLPKRDYPDAEQKKKVNRVISAVIIVMVLPALYFAYTFVQQNNFNQNANKYIAQEFEAAGHVVIYRDISQRENKIELAVLGQRFTESDIAVFNAKLPQYDLDTTNLVLRQDEFSLSEEEWEQILLQVQSDDEKIATLEARAASERASFMSPSKILEEAKTINSLVSDIAVGMLNYGSLENEITGPRQVVTVYTSEPLSNDAAEQLRSWLRTRLQEDQLAFYFIPETANDATQP
ncbi:TIGR00341 family protein [bacterium]|nr:TIGR00341 family protein [bacterium]